MVQLDIPAAFVASQLFLDAGRKIIKKEAAEGTGNLPAVYYKFLFRSVFFAALVIAPAGIYLLTGWPGWEQLYWTERVEKPIFNLFNAIYYPLFIMAIVLAAYVGHIIGYRWLVTGKEKYLRPTYIFILLAALVLVLAQYPAFTLVGTYQQYYSDRESMGLAWNNPYDFSIGWLGVVTYFVISFLYLFIKIITESRKY